VLASRAELCDPPLDNKWAGKIVVVDTFCWDRGFTYASVQQAGAVALVERIPVLPGINTFSHMEWDPNTANQGRSMPFVASPLDCYIDDATVLHLGPPHNDEYFNLFTSPVWNLGIRIVIPVASILTSLIAFAESYRASKLLSWTTHAGNAAPVIHPANYELWTMGIAICLIEGVSTFLLALAFALGQQGPQMLPRAFHDMFFTLLTGTSLVTSVFIVLLIKERLRVAPPRCLPLRLMSEAYRYTLILLPVCCIGLDIGAGIGRTFSFDDDEWKFYVLLGACYIICSAAVGFIFLYYAAILAAPLYEFLRIRKRPGRPRSEEALMMDRKMRCITRTLAFNGGVLVTFPILQLWFVSMVARGVPNVLEYGVFTFVAVLTRVLLSYWHVQVIRPADASSSFRFVLQLARHWKLGRGRRAARVQPAEYIVSSIPESTLTSVSSFENFDFSIEIPTSGGCLEELSAVCSSPDSRAAPYEMSKSFDGKVPTLAFQMK
jgi:hypothetical protein